MPKSRASKSLRPLDVSPVDSPLSLPAMASTREPSPRSTPAVTLPPFITSDPQLWFLQVEALMKSRGITDGATRYGTVVGALPAPVASAIRETLFNPSSSYEDLKTALLAHFSRSARSNVHQLLHTESVGDGTPSQLLTRMRRLAEGDGNSPLMRELFLQKLPAPAAFILRSRGELPLNELARVADDLLDTPPTELHSIAERPTDLMKQIKDLKASVEELARQADSRKNRPLRPAPSGDSGLCFYHERFGDRARKCSKPCNWKSSEPQASRQ